VPTHGYRHAATLLLTNSVRLLPADASPALVSEALLRLARDLVDLASDTRASADALEWTVDAYSSALDRVQVSFSHRTDGDFPKLLDTLKTRGAEILEAIAHIRNDDTPRDLFMMYLPEDRLPIAAPLAIELTKRRFTIAFSDFEISTHEEMLAAVEHGLARHLAGILLVTPAFDRRGWAAPLRTSHFRLLRPDAIQATADNVAAWLRALRM